jgi:hypothetical protein
MNEHDQPESALKPTGADISRVYVSDDLYDARLICNRLVSEGVRARIVGDALPYIGSGTAGRVEVWVDEQDGDRAEGLLTAWNVKTHASEPKTRRFQFSLLGIFLLVTMVAALLGVAVDPQASQVVWGAVAVLFWVTIFVVFIRRRFGRRIAHRQPPDRNAGTRTDRGPRPDG